MPAQALLVDLIGALYMEAQAVSALPTKPDGSSNAARTGMVQPGRN